MKNVGTFNFNDFNMRKIEDLSLPVNTIRFYCQENQSPNIPRLVPQEVYRKIEEYLKKFD